MPEWVKGAECHIENRFFLKVLLFFVIVSVTSFEERGRRELHRITDDNDLMTTGNGSYCFFGSDLARLINDDYIKFHTPRFRKLRNGNRGHHPTGLKNLYGTPSTAKQIPNRNAGAL